MFSATAERERTRIIQRSKEGRRLAMRNGVKMGWAHRVMDGAAFQIDFAPAPASSEALGGGREHAPRCARFQREPQHHCPAALKRADVRNRLMAPALRGQLEFKSVFEITSYVALLINTGSLADHFHSAAFVQDRALNAIGKRSALAIENVSGPKIIPPNALSIKQ